MSQCSYMWCRCAATEKPDIALAGKAYHPTCAARMKTATKIREACKVISGYTDEALIKALTPMIMEKRYPESYILYAIKYARTHNIPITSIGKLQYVSEFGDIKAAYRAHLQKKKADEIRRQMESYRPQTTMKTFTWASQQTGFASILC